MAWDNSSRIHSSVACNLDQDILLTLLPLFAAGEIEGIEWSFDTLYDRTKIPDWFYDLLQAYGEQNQLVGHGVFFSILSGQWKAEQYQWLQHLSAMSSKFGFDHVTEHFGFTTGKNFHTGAPLSVPMNNSTLAIGIDRLQRIQEAANSPVGLENLAFAYHQDEVQRQGNFLNELIQPVNGFIILDLHNIYCQAHNFDIDPADLIQYYPLDRVREIHISGGSWDSSRVAPNLHVRRDTHDGAVPEEVFALLPIAISQCPQLKYVVLEQLGTALKTQNERSLFQSDFKRMKNIVKASKLQNCKVEDFQCLKTSLAEAPLIDQELHYEQLALSNILESSQDITDAKRKLAKSKLMNSDWQVEKWDDKMLDTAILIAQKWK